MDPLVQSQSPDNIDYLQPLIKLLRGVFKRDSNQDNKYLACRRLPFLVLMDSESTQMVLVTQCLEHLLDTHCTLLSVSTCLQIVHFPGFQKMFPSTHKYWRIRTSIRLREYYRQIGNVIQSRQVNNFVEAQLLLLMGQVAATSEKQTQAFYIRELVKSYEFSIRNRSLKNTSDQADLLCQYIKTLQSFQPRNQSLIQKGLMKMYYRLSQIQSGLGQQVLAERNRQISMNIASRIQSAPKIQIEGTLVQLQRDRLQEQ